MTKPQYVSVIYIRTTPEKLWAALTDAQTIKKYCPAAAPAGRRSSPASGARWRRGLPLSIKMAPPQEMLEALRALKR